MNTLKRLSSRTVWLLSIAILGMVVAALDVRILLWINPLKPLPVLDSFFNIYTDHCGPWVGIPLGVLGLSFAIRFFRKRTWWCNLAVLGFVFLATASRVFYSQGSERLVLLFAWPSLILAAWFLSRKDSISLHKAERVALAALLSLSLGGGLVTREMKQAFKRPRPLNPHYAFSEQIRGFEREYLTGKTSFPSGHSSSAWSMCIPLFLVYKGKKRYLFLLIAGLNSLSRVYLAVHFPTDVYVGALLGVASGFTANAIVFGTSLGKEP